MFYRLITLSLKLLAMQIEEALNRITVQLSLFKLQTEKTILYDKYVTKRPDRIVKISKHKMKDIGVIHFVSTNFLG